MENCRVSALRYQLLPERSRDEDVLLHIQKALSSDCNPGHNLAGFVCTTMQKWSESLLMENLSKNCSNKSEYAGLTSLQDCCVSILARLWGAHADESPIGAATTGSSEAIMLAGMALKRLWREKRCKEAKDWANPNVVMSSNSHTALFKFARYFEVDCRVVPVCEDGYTLDPVLVKDAVDENTIGVFLTLGTTYTGYYEPVNDICSALDEVEEVRLIDIPVHVDAASGGFVAPFALAKTGGKVWDFGLPRVKSINVSGHKYGQVFAGLGWIIWRDTAFLPPHLRFDVNYLSGIHQSYTLSFSRPGGHVVAQYFNFLSLGFEGFREDIEYLLANARLLSIKLEATGSFRCISNIHRRIDIGVTCQRNGSGDSSALYYAGLPVVVFTFSKDVKNEYPSASPKQLSSSLQLKGYMLPCYTLPNEGRNVEVLRIVCRPGMNQDFASRLADDICVSMSQLLSSCSQASEALC